MASIVSAGTTSATALNMSADTTGILQLASNNGTVGVTLSTAQNLMIGSTSDNGYKLKVVGGSASNFLLDNTGGQFTQLLLQRNSTANTGGDLLIDGTNSQFQIRGLLAGPMLFQTSATAGSPVERMRISSDGYVTTPYQPMFVANSTANAYVAVATAGTIILNSTKINTASGYNTATGIFTAPSTGRYLFISSLYNISGANVCLFDFTYNGGTYQRMSFQVTASGDLSFFGQCICSMAAGDTMRVLNNSGASRSLFMGTDLHTSFSGYLIG